jgi:hypothetical protein
LRVTLENLGYIAFMFKGNAVSILMIATLLMLFTSLTTTTVINSYAQTGSMASLETIQAAYAVGIV